MENYIHLVSDHSIDIFHDNSPSHFTNQLAHGLHFREPSAVCLKGIEFSNSIANIVANLDRLILFDFEHFWEPLKPPNQTQEPRWGKYYNVGLKTGYYSDPLKICKKLNAKIKGTMIKRVSTTKIFSYDQNLKKFSINVSGLSVSLLIRRNLIGLFGLSDSSTYKGEFVVLGNSKTKDFYLKKNEKRFFLEQDERRWRSDSKTGGVAAYKSNLDINSVLNVELDILCSQLYGSKYTKILRTFYLEPEIKFGQRIYKEFPSQAYFPLIQTSLTSLTVKLTDHMGDQIFFSRGNVKVFLAFRPQRLVY